MECKKCGEVMMLTYTHGDGYFEPFEEYWECECGGSMEYQQGSGENWI